MSLQTNTKNDEDWFTDMTAESKEELSNEKVINKDSYYTQYFTSALFNNPISGNTYKASIDPSEVNNSEQNIYFGNEQNLKKEDTGIKYKRILPKYEKIVKLKEAAIIGKEPKLIKEEKPEISLDKSPINKDEEIILNIEELADELAEMELKINSSVKYEDLLEKYKKVILKHERRQKI
jgi:hypothetical protein